MALQSPAELFMEEMGSAYTAEQMISQIMPQLAKESNNPQVTNAFQTQEQEARQHVQNLEQCFQILGQRPPQKDCYAVAGIKQDHDAFVKKNPSPDVLTAFDLGAADKTAHLEMASYKGLIEKANLMGQPQVAQLLQQNYQQEQATAQRVEQISTQIGQQLTQKMP